MLRPTRNCCSRASEAPQNLLGSFSSGGTCLSDMVVSQPILHVGIYIYDLCVPVHVRICTWICHDFMMKHLSVPLRFWPAKYPKSLRHKITWPPEHIPVPLAVILAPGQWEMLLKLCAIYSGWKIATTNLFKTITYSWKPIKHPRILGRPTGQNKLKPNEKFRNFT